MLNEVLENLALKRGDVVVDVTAGFGGHLQAIAQAVGDTGRAIGIDQDPEALTDLRAGKVVKQFPGRAKLFHAAFSELQSILRGDGVDKIDGLLCDLGVSSGQLDEPERGFSFMRDGPLDMRMNPTKGPSALDVIKSSSERDLADIIYQYGEERKSRRIASVIKNARPLPTSTLALADLIAKAMGGQRSKIHPATKTFQALRIYVNAELDELDALLAMLPHIMAPQGRAAIISFHSLEDRRVKIAFKSLAHQKDESGRSHWRLVHKKALQPSDAEVKQNPRARSAKLRVIERLGDNT